MTKNLNFNLWVLLLVLIVFFSSSNIAYAAPSDTSDSSHSSTPRDEEENELLTIAKGVQQAKGINTQANNYMVFHYRGLYYIHISEKNFELGTFTYELIQRTGIKTSGWWLYSTNLDPDPDTFNDWQYIPWSNKNYDMKYYDENYITYQGEVVVNFALDKEPILHIMYCSEDVEGFYSSKTEEEETEGDTTPDYTEQHETIIDKIGNIGEAIVNLPSQIAKSIGTKLTELFIPSDNYLLSKRVQIEQSFSKLMGFNVSEVQNMFEYEDTSEIVISGENSKININGIGEIEFKTFDNKFLLDGLNKFRPIIRGFTVLMLAFFNLNQLLNIIGQSSLTGLTNSYKGGKKE